MQCHGVGEVANSETIHHVIKDGNKFSDLVVYNNCYAISCHALAWVIESNCHTEGVLQIQSTFLPLPL